MPKAKKKAKKVRCSAKTTNGKKCKRWASKPSKYCYQHKKK